MENKIVLILIVILFNPLCILSQIRNLQNKDSVEFGVLLPGKVPNYSVPTVYDFGHVSNLVLNSNGDENSVAGGVNLYRARKEGDCGSCLVGDMVFLRGKVIFPQNEIKKGLSSKSLNLEVGFRQIIKSSMFYFYNDTDANFNIEDTCCLSNYCDSWKNSRAFNLGIDYSMASEHWMEYSVLGQQNSYVSFNNSNFQNDKIVNSVINISYNYFRKFNHTTLVRNSASFISRALSFVAFKGGIKFGQFDNLSLIKNVFSISNSTTSVIGGQVFYSTPQQAVSSNPGQGFGGDLYLIGVVGLRKWLSFAITGEKLKGFSTNISGISNTTLKCDLLFNLPKSEDCEGKRTYNLTLGLNVLFQQFGDPILGIGASIPFDN